MMHFVIVLFIVMLGALAIVLSGGKEARANKVRWVKANPLAASAAVAGLFFAALAQDKPPTPPPPPPPPKPIEAGVIYLYIDPGTGQAWLLDGDIINLGEGEAFP